MKRTVSAVDARKRFGEILESVHYRGDEIIIERAGKPMAVVIPPERYDQLRRSRERILDFLEKNWELNKDVPSEEIEREVMEAVRDIRRRAAQPRKTRR